MIRSGEVDRNSQFVGTIVELFRERMGKVCAKGDCIRHQSSFAQGLVHETFCSRQAFLYHIDVGGGCWIRTVTNIYKAPMLCRII